ncbi:MAG: hypothetical protein WEK74_08840 [Hydrogenophaga sp.]
MNEFGSTLGGYLAIGFIRFFGNLARELGAGARWLLVGRSLGAGDAVAGQFCPTSKAMAQAIASSVGTKLTGNGIRQPTQPQWKISVRTTFLS